MQVPPAEAFAAVIGGSQGLGGSCATIGPRRDFLSADGSTSLVLDGDEYESAQLILVLLSDSGNILAQRPTQVGVDV